MGVTQANPLLRQTPAAVQDPWSLLYKEIKDIRSGAIAAIAAEAADFPAPPETLSTLCNKAIKQDQLATIIAFYIASGGLTFVHISAAPYVVTRGPTADMYFLRT